jgi:NADP-dependent aldehyde dehydrogenase
MTFADATAAGIDAAVRAAEAAFETFRATSGDTRARLLAAVGEEILAVGDALIERAMAETALPRPRLEGERTRTVLQLKMYGEAAREGSILDARLDRAIPDRKPFAKPELRMMNVPLGPVAVFGASNFPLAYSTAGGDTASALAAGCPVVVKAHPAHPGTGELVAGAVRAAVRRCGLPDGLFGTIHGRSNAVGAALVQHPLIKAVGFTGSLAGGRALFDLAARRAEPIPVFAEMGSVNPVFLLPGALAERAEAIAEAFATSATLGLGQFCTKPGMALAVGGPAADRFVRETARRMAETPAGTMLHPGIREAFERGLAERRGWAGVEVAGSGPGATLLRADGAALLRDPRLAEELFGPSSIYVGCRSRDELLEAARRLPGSLTATIHGTAAELAEYQDLVAVLVRKVGRLVFNGVPTGVEVSGAMMHGGPYPATTDSRFTSVGPAAIARFLRPVCFQNFPDAAMPPALRARNELGIWRRIDGTLTKDDL